jgi:hypothetical protein
VGVLLPALPPFVGRALLGADSLEPAAGVIQVVGWEPAAASLFPGALLLVDTEVLLIRFAGDVLGMAATGGGILDLLVARGQNGTLPTPHRVGAVVYILLPGASGADAAPMLVQDRGWVVSVAGQASLPVALLPSAVAAVTIAAGRSVQNCVTVTLTANVDIVGPFGVTIGGLNGSATASSAAFPLWDPLAGLVGGCNLSDIFGAEATWNQAAGELRARLLAGRRLHAGEPCRLAFAMDSPAAATGLPARLWVASDGGASNCTIHYEVGGAEASEGSAALGVSGEVVIMAPGTTIISAAAACVDQAIMSPVNANYTLQT